MTADEWREAILAAPNDAVRTVKAITFLKRWGSFSQPVAVSCDDGDRYVIKGAQVGRAIVNDHIVGRLGGLVDAPVGDVVFVDATDLARIEPQVAHVRHGLAHGTRLIPDTSDRLRYEYAGRFENRERFAALCTLYSWAGCFQDHQFIYEENPPHAVYSVDHGHFFPGGPNWSVAGIQAPPAAVIDGDFSSCALTQP